MDTLAFILSAAALLCITGATLVRGERMKTILLLLLAGNLLYAISYLVGGKGINGAYSCLLGATLVFIKYFFDRRGRTLPMWLAGLYAVAFIALNIYLTGISLPAVLMIFAALTFLVSVLQKNGAAFRLWTLANTVSWCVYDTITGAYGALATHIFMLLSTLTGILLHDLKKHGQN